MPSREPVTGAEKFAGLIARETFRELYTKQQKIGRPTKLTPELIDDLITEYSRAPIGRDAVCDKIGICDESRRRWIKQGEADAAQGLETRASAFSGVFKKARGYWQGVLLEGVLLGTQQWVAYMTLLERIWPMEYGRRTDDNNSPRVLVQVGGMNQSDVKVSVATFASHDATVNPVIHSLTVDHGSDNSDYGELPPALTGQVIEAVVARDPAGDPSRHQGPSSGCAPVSAVKASRAARKKKGSCPA